MFPPVSCCIFTVVVVCFDSSIIFLLLLPCLWLSSMYDHTHYTLYNEHVRGCIRDYDAFSCSVFSFPFCFSLSWLRGIHAALFVFMYMTVQLPLFFYSCVERCRWT
ncbi:hypothetical protein L210DRAFT_3591113 [Boletus edulis BED1]|uniref:Uncharacterized protein n=2 Tax=Boletus edulis BED1 TaxID=1328754 RepID=A0AAD4G4I8_BOLED|nr:hypothetical protein L210DRAFT_3591113 [Boletus edulis BED1]